MEEIILFIMCYILIFIVYELFIIRPAKKRKKEKEDKKKRKSKKSRDKELFEIVYLQGRYKLDMSKVNYNQLLQICAIVSSFDIALIVSLMELFDNFFLKILFCLVFTIIIILLSYHLVYLFYKKKGMIKK